MAGVLTKPSKAGVQKRGHQGQQVLLRAQEQPQGRPKEKEPRANKNDKSPAFASSSDPNRRRAVPVSRKAHDTTGFNFTKPVTDDELLVFSAPPVVRP